MKGSSRYEGLTTQGAQWKRPSERNAEQLSPPLPRLLVGGAGTWLWLAGKRNNSAEYCNL